MIQEDALIPYQTSPIPKGPWLVFAPHPDDETFGMGGSLLLAASEGIDVVLVVFTDGSLGGTTADEDKVCSPSRAGGQRGSPASPFESRSLLAAKGPAATGDPRVGGSSS